MVDKVYKRSGGNKVTLRRPKFQVIIRGGDVIRNGVGSQIA